MTTAIANNSAKTMIRLYMAAPVSPITVPLSPVAPDYSARWMWEVPIATATDCWPMRHSDIIHLTDKRLPAEVPHGAHGRSGGICHRRLTRDQRVPFTESRCGASVPMDKW